MDSRAKQRVTGAVILAALFVLLVPELLKGPHATDSPATTPTDDGMSRYTIDLNAPASPASRNSSQPAVVLPPVTENAPSALATPGKSAAPEVPPPEPANAATPPPSPVPAPAQANTMPAPVDEPRAAAVASPARPADHGSFVVQLGSFGSRENANRLVHDMTAKGFAAFVAPISSGGRELYRVRVGPTHDRASAETLAAQLRRIGQSGSIVPIS
jgi:DedD protein